MVVSVQHLRRLDFTLLPWAWPFATERRGEIDAFFRREQDKNPALWNGRLLLTRSISIAGGTMSASFFETDYASMLAGLAWQAMGDIKCCFPAAALLASDDAFVLGEMAPHTRNAGQIFFPCGSAELIDATDGRVDFFATLQRELLEETGIAAEGFEPAEGWHALTLGPLVPLIKIMRAPVPAAELRQRICANLAAQHEPELLDMWVVRGLDDVGESTPAWVTEFLRYFWKAGRSADGRG
jgi:8-oxo-dGTP pyrophosphatase MutT (NUDIX family)